MSYSTKLQSCGLFKVLNTALEDQLIFCSVDILGKVAADADDDRLRRRLFKLF